MRRMTLILLVPIICLAMAGGVLAMSSSSYRLPWEVVSSGGGMRGSPSYLLGDTTGQSAVGISQSSNYRLEAGFWSGATVVAPPVSLPGDANGDGHVDAVDLAAVATAFNAKEDSPNWNPSRDLNQDGIVDIYDLVLVGVNFGKTSPPNP